MSPHTLKHWRITSGDKTPHVAACPLLGDDILPLAWSLVWSSAHAVHKALNLRLLNSLLIARRHGWITGVRPPGIVTVVMLCRSF